MTLESCISSSYAYCSTIILQFYIPSESEYGEIIEIEIFVAKSY